MPFVIPTDDGPMRLPSPDPVIPAKTFGPDPNYYAGTSTKVPVAVAWPSFLPVPTFGALSTALSARGLTLASAPTLANGQLTFAVEARGGLSGKIDEIKGAIGSALVTALMAAGLITTASYTAAGGPIDLGRLLAGGTKVGADAIQQGGGSLLLLVILAGVLIYLASR